MLSLRNNKPLSNVNLAQFYITNYEPSHLLSVEFQTNFTVRMKQRKISRLRQMQRTPLLVRIIGFCAEAISKHNAAGERRRIEALSVLGSSKEHPIRPIALVRETTKSPRKMLKTLTKLTATNLNALKGNSVTNLTAMTGNCEPESAVA